MKVDLTALEGFEPPGSIPNVAKKKAFANMDVQNIRRHETVAAVRKYTLEYR